MKNKYNKKSNKEKNGIILPETDNINNDVNQTVDVSEDTPISCPVLSKTEDNSENVSSSGHKKKGKRILLWILIVLLIAILAVCIRFWHVLRLVLNWENISAYRNSQKYTKEEIRQIAKEAGLPVAHKKDSQEICFIPDHDYAAFIDKEARERVPGPGNFVTKDGKVLGEHKGITHYTIGQRKGLNLAMGHPVFVTKICPKTHQVVIGENEDTYTNSLICDTLNFMGMEDLREPRKVWAKIRYSHKGEECLLERIGEDRIRCTLPILFVQLHRARPLYFTNRIMFWVEVL